MLKGINLRIVFEVYYCKINVDFVEDVRAIKQRDAKTADPDGQYFAVGYADPVTKKVIRFFI